MFSHHLLATKFRTSTQRSIIAVRAISQALIEVEDCWTKPQQQKNKPQEVVTHYRVAASWGFFQYNVTAMGCNLLCTYHLFQSNTTRAGCNSKLVQTRQQVVMYFVQYLPVLLTTYNGYILFTATRTQPFTILFGAKQPIK